MSFPINKLIPLLVKETNPTDVISTLVRDIIVLEEKMNNAEEQSFYFQMGLGVHAHKLNALKADYKKYRGLINENSIDYFISRLNNAREKLYKVEEGNRTNPSFIHFLAKAGCKSDVTELENLIYAKSKYKTLKPLKEYLDNK